ncbi:MAG: 3-isopropylmalate dehydrogenase, partial [Okeania sp. SIO2H7]|nr:3-isopropylmalate dehydrogenase [Okeania sp. SIO2H7]
GGAIAGSIGLLGSASLNADGFGMYEAVHGTAPDIAGKGIANPLGTLAGVMLMLGQWGEHQAVERLRSIQNDLLAQGYRTADLYPGALSHAQGDPQCSTLTPVNLHELTTLFIEACRAEE